MSDYPLAWSADLVKYLGVWVHKDPEIVLNMNYGRALNVVTEQISRWKRLPLSLADRIAVVKMTVLPKLLYLFVNIPIKLTYRCF